MGRRHAKPSKKKPKADPQPQAHEAALLRQQREQQRKYEEQRVKTLQSSKHSEDENLRATVASTARSRFESFKSFFKHLNGIVRLIAFAVALGALSWSWQVLGADEYLVAFLLLGAFLFFVLVSLYGWKGVPEYSTATKAVKILLLGVVVVIAGYSAGVFQKKKGDKPWTALWTTHNGIVHTTSSSTSAVTATTHSELELARNELRADALRPIRDVAFRLKLSRQYSIEELRHFRIIFEIFDNQTLDFFIACQDAYSINESVDLSAKQFGIRCTVHYRIPPKGRFEAIPIYTKPPRYTTLIDRVQSVDTLEWSIDLYNQIPSYKTIEDLNRKYLYIFVTGPLTEKMSDVSFKVNNWELVSAKSELLTFPDDRPIARWFIPLSKDEASVRWRGVYFKGSGEIAERLGQKEVPFVWSLDFGIIHPKKLPEPKNVIEPFK